MGVVRNVCMIAGVSGPLSPDVSGISFLTATGRKRVAGRILLSLLLKHPVLISFRQGRAPLIVCLTEQTTLCRALRSCLVLFIPGGDVPHAPEGAEVIPKYLRGYPEFPQVSEVKQSLPYLSHHSVSMQCPP